MKSPWILAVALVACLLVSLTTHHSPPLPPGPSECVLNSYSTRVDRIKQEGGYLYVIENKKEWVITTQFIPTTIKVPQEQNTEGAQQ